MTKTEKAMFRAAKAMSEMSDYKVKVGCVVANKRRIISSGFSSDSKRHRIQAILDKETLGCECLGKLHAETMALLPLIRNGVDLSKVSIYIYRQHKDGSLACAKPCARCEKLIKKLGIKRVYFTVENGFAEEKW